LLAVEVLEHPLIDLEAAAQDCDRDTGDYVSLLLADRLASNRVEGFHGVDQLRV
tara:strand:+ start:2472 stop:2633 length:162 start_codon:yes stop_codon:yes gene_type:complete